MNTRSDGSVRGSALGVSLLLLTAAVAMAEPKPDSQSGLSAESTETIQADMEWPTPRLYAIILDEHALILTLHTTKDIVFAETVRERLSGRSSRSYRILAVETGALLLRESRTGERVQWRLGTTLPEFAHRRLVGIVLLKQLQYHFKLAEQISRPDPVLLAMDGLLAVLEQQVLKGGPTAAATALRPEQATPRLWQDVPVFLKTARIHALSPDTYEIAGPALRASLENVGQLLSEVKLMVSPRLTAQAGLDFQVSSALADGVLGQSGFTITNSKVAQMFGIEVGDRIAMLNGQPVTSPLNAWWVYQEAIIRNPGQAEMRLDLYRGSTLIRKTYRIP